MSIAADKRSIDMRWRIGGGTNFVRGIVCLRDKWLWIGWKVFQKPARLVALDSCSTILSRDAESNSCFSSTNEQHILAHQLSSTIVCSSCSLLHSLSTSFGPISSGRNRPRPVRARTRDLFRYCCFSDERGQKTNFYLLSERTWHAEKIDWNFFLARALFARLIPISSHRFSKARLNAMNFEHECDYHLPFPSVSH